LNILWLWCKTS